MAKSTEHETGPVKETVKKVFKGAMMLMAGLVLLNLGSGFFKP